MGIHHFLEIKVNITAQTHQDKSVNRISATRCLSEVFGREHALGTAQDGVLGRIVRVLFGRDLQHGRDRLHVGINGVPDHLSDELIYQDDTNVVTCQEAPAEEKKKNSPVRLPRQSPATI